MAATREEIESWFEAGLARGAKYMLVICDTFDHDDYPSYFETREAAERMKKSPGDMERVMEVYDLSADPAPQLSARRAMAL